jgi:hypothetical protein
MLPESTLNVLKGDRFIFSAPGPAPLQDALTTGELTEQTVVCPNWCLFKLLS